MQKIVAHIEESCAFYRAQRLARQARQGEAKRKP
jgi:hypothetical protein